MTHTIAGTYATLVTLGTAIDNPTTITQYGLLTDGLQVAYQGLTVVNAGGIAGLDVSGGFGIDLTAGGSVTNQSGGVISGNDGIVDTAGAVTVVNAGSIAAKRRGVMPSSAKPSRLPTESTPSELKLSREKGLPGISSAMTACKYPNASGSGSTLRRRCAASRIMRSSSVS